MSWQIEIFMWEAPKTFLSWTHGGNTSLVQNPFCLVPKNSDALEAVSPAAQAHKTRSLLFAHGALPCHLLTYFIATRPIATP